MGFIRKRGSDSVRLYSSEYMIRVTSISKISLTVQNTVGNVGKQLDKRWDFTSRSRARIKVRIRVTNKSNSRAKVEVGVGVGVGIG